jgi:nucleoside-diphosphate-sugar epimerase
MRHSWTAGRAHAGPAVENWMWKPRRKQRVAITGAAGLVGTVVRRGLEPDHELRTVDRRAVAGSDCLIVDMTDLDAARRAFQGAHTVVDLAAIARADAGWEEVWANNIRATLNAFEAARRAGVRRLVFASSSHVTGLYERDHPYSAIVAGDYRELDPAQIPYITTTHPVRPDGAYAVGKVAGEAAARYQAESSDLSVICLRLGTVTRDGRPRNARHFATLLTHGDLVRLVDAAIRAPDGLEFGIFYGVSANTWRFWDIDDARERIEYVPLDNAETWRRDDFPV